MRRIALLLVAALAAPGCSWLQPGVATTGWKVEIGTPSVIAAPALVQQTSGGVTAMALAAGPASGPTLAQLAASPCAPAAGPTLAMPRLAAGSEPCDLETVCRKLGLIEQRISVLETYKTMPKGAP